jgi:hypothetical protein
MAKRLRLFRGHRFLGGRGVAHKVRLAAEDALRSSRNTVVILDFAQVEGVSHSFADELLSPLSELLDDRCAKRVLLANCTPEVLEELEIVAMMHGLVMPGLTAGSDRPAGAKGPHHRQ